MAQTPPNLRMNSPIQAITDRTEAIRWAQFCKSQAFDPSDPLPSEVLAAAYAEAGKTEEAIEEQQRAIELARSDRHRQSLQLRLQLYQSGKAFHRSQ